MIAATNINTNSQRPGQSYWKTMRYLILREYWEYKSLYLWLPLILGAVMFFLFTYFMVGSMRGKDLAALMAMNIPQIVTTSNFFPSMYWPLAWTAALVGLYHLMASLHSDRLDRSVMFWKSLPVSDGQAVVSKIVFPLVIGPFFAFICSLFAYLGFCLVACVYVSLEGQNIFSSMFFSYALWKDPLQVFSLFPIYFAWALPTVGWVMLVSASAKSRVFPWAFGLPFLAELMLVFTNFHFKLEWNMLWITNNIFARIVGGLFPGLWTMADSPAGIATVEHNMFLIESAYTQGWFMLTSPKLWLGVFAGIAMIIMSIRQRRYADVI